MGSLTFSACGWNVAVGIADGQSFVDDDAHLGQLGHAGLGHGLAVGTELHVLQGLLGTGFHARADFLAGVGPPCLTHVAFLGRTAVGPAGEGGFAFNAYFDGAEGAGHHAHLAADAQGFANAHQPVELLDGTEGAGVGARSVLTMAALDGVANVIHLHHFDAGDGGQTALLGLLEGEVDVGADAGDFALLAADALVRIGENNWIFIRTGHDRNSELVVPLQCF